MAFQTKVTCLTDLKDSTALMSTLGQESFSVIQQDYLRVGRVIGEFSSGNYVKSIGNAHMLVFDDIESPLLFVTRLQEYYRTQPALRRTQLETRIGLFLGTVDPISQDYFGPGVNQAARVESKAQPGEVIVNKGLVDSFQNIWSAVKISQYFTSVGSHKLKGISTPEEQELFRFNWEQYSNHHANQGLAHMIYEHLKLAKVEVSNLLDSDFASPATIIWPVVPRDVVTAIHRAQTEIIRLLTLLGWNVYILIADCGATNNYPRPKAERFRSELAKHLENRSIVSTQGFLSDFFAPSSPDYEQVQTLFRRIASDLTLADLLEINNKSYSDADKSDIQRSKTLDALRPALTIAAVLHLIRDSPTKGIVVSGLDELVQWERAYDIDETRNRIGVLMNPILKQDDNHQMRQKSSWPSWYSTDALIRSMSTGNLAWWTFHLHAFVPNFPEQTVCVGESQVVPSSWPDQYHTPAGMTCSDLAGKVWSLLTL